MIDQDEHQVVQWMQQTRDAWAALREHGNMAEMPAEWAYASYEDYLLDLGQAWEPQALPDGYEPGEIKNCYENTLLLVVADHASGGTGELRYVEGRALGKACIAVDHAWAVDGKGRVVDVTWPEPADAHYWGVEYALPDVVAVVIEQDSYGLIANDWTRGNQLLRHGVLLGGES